MYETLLGNYTLTNAQKCFDQIETVDFLNYFLKKVKKRELYIILRRYFYKDTFRSIAEDMQLSIERIRQIEGRGMRRMKEAYYVSKIKFEKPVHFEKPVKYTFDVKYLKLIFGKER